MRLYTSVTLLLLLAVLSACSKDKAEQAHSNPAANSNTQSGTSQGAPTMPTTPISGGNIPNGGKVVKAMHAGGYTYMELESEGKVFWIAATMMNVKRDDNVAWTDAALMKNFKSPSLRRNFDEILFVSNAKVQ